MSQTVRNHRPVFWRRGRFIAFGATGRAEKKEGKRHLPFALPSSRSVAHESLLSVALSSYRAFRLYHFGYGVPSGLNFVIKMGPFSL